MKKQIKNYIMDVICLLLGSILFAVSINVFTAPNQIAPGGLSGIGTLLNYLFHIPIGLTIIVCNIPIFIWGWRSIGGKFLIKTIFATLLSSALIDALSPWLPAYHGDMFLVTVFGGISAGAGLSLIFMRGGTTGGTDLVARLLQIKFRHISLGRLMMGIDLCIVLLSAFVYRSYETPLYAVIVIFITTKVVDTVLYGTDSGTGKIMFIISQHSQEIAKGIITSVGRGVTALQARGGYSNLPSEVLLCAVWRQEVYKTYDTVYAIDPDAFIIVGDAGEITGEGFKKMVEQQKKIKNSQK